jgi:hypothetical protein
MEQLKRVAKPAMEAAMCQGMDKVAGKLLEKEQDFLAAFMDTLLPLQSEGTGALLDKLMTDPTFQITLGNEMLNPSSKISQRMDLIGLYKVKNLLTNDDVQNLIRTNIYKNIGNLDKKESIANSDIQSKQSLIDT